MEYVHACDGSELHKVGHGGSNNDETKRKVGMSSPRTSGFDTSSYCPVREKKESKLALSKHRMDIRIDFVEHELEINLWPRECYYINSCYT